MDQKRRMALVIAIGITIIIGVLSGFGLPLFFQTYDVDLPSYEDMRPIEPGTSRPNPDESSDFTLVRVSPETVQAVVKTLSRRAQYYRELKIELYFGAAENRQSAISTLLIWNDGAASNTAIRDADGTLQHCLVADGRAYIWYGASRAYFAYKAGEERADLLQRIPSYEDVLQLEQSQIVRAGYEEKLGSNCIFVEAKIPEFSYLERYWVSTETGLLVAAETVREADGLVLYSMAEKLITALGDSEETFMLPDGAVLHRAVIAQTEE